MLLKRWTRARSWNGKVSRRGGGLASLIGISVTFKQDYLLLYFHVTFLLQTNCCLLTSNCFKQAVKIAVLNYTLNYS